MSGVAGENLGTLPTTDDYPLFFCSGNESNTLCSAIINISPTPALPSLPFQSDIFFINALTSNSLAQVTSTLNSNETPLSF